MADNELNQNQIEGRDPKLNPAIQPDVYVTCPYFPEHKLRRSRLVYHLLKCQKNPSAPKLVACPYNYSHRVSLEERLNHLITCEDRPTKFSDREMPSYGKTVKLFGKKKDLPKEWNNPLPESEREWWP